MDERSEIVSRISEVAADVLARPGLVLTEATTARDVPGWDSLTHVQIVIGVERVFGIRLSALEVAQLENVGSLVDAILSRRR